jgi:hypothetical protein
MLLKIDLSEHLCIKGDLNMDLLCEKGKNLKNFINNFNFQNCVNTLTRVAHYKYVKTKVSRTTTSLIDVCIPNYNVVNKALAVDCPFSDH